jgi:hypothetical protein
MTSGTSAIFVNSRMFLPVNTIKISIIGTNQKVPLQLPCNANTETAYTVSLKISKKTSYVDPIVMKHHTCRVITNRCCINSVRGRFTLTSFLQKFVRLANKSGRTLWIILKHNEDNNTHDKMSMEEKISFIENQ